MYYHTHILRSITGTSEDTTSFIMKVQTDIESASSEFVIPTRVGLTYDFAVDWGDGNTSTGQTGNISHIYASAGTYIIKVSGTFPAMQTTSSTTANAKKIVEVMQWGNMSWRSFIEAFDGCTNLSITAIDVPDLSLCTSFFSAFDSTPASLNINGSMGSWDVSTITDFSFCFNASGMNVDISGWDTSSATNMAQMFTSAPNFNQPVGSWNVSNVTTFLRMFQGASSFNQNLSAWNTSSAQTFQQMFNASAFNNGGDPGINNWVTSSVGTLLGMFQSCPFNQPIGSWNTSSVTNLQSVFAGNSSFNQDIGGWSVGFVTNASAMFLNASAFNNGGSASINNWNVSSITNFTNMFSFASSFNQPIGSWNVSSGIDMTQMFWGATIFNQDIGSWDVSNVTKFLRFAHSTAFNNGGSASINNWDMSSATDLRQMFFGTPFNQPVNGWTTTGSFTMTNRMFTNATAFNQPVDAWNMSNVTDMGYMFNGATAFNQSLFAWSTGSLQNAETMFASASAFDQDISGWNVTSLTNASNMLNLCAMSTANYDALLVGWEAQAVQNNVTLGASGRTYTIGSAAETARTALINDHSWTINDAGGV